MQRIGTKNEVNRESTQQKKQSQKNKRRKDKKHNLLFKDNLVTLNKENEGKLIIVLAKSMDIQLNIGFDQLVSIIKRLPPTQWRKLKNEVDKAESHRVELKELERFLMTAPTLTDEQLEAIADARNHFCYSL